MENLSQEESYFDIVLYLMTNGCGNDEDRAKLLCDACEHGKLDVVKELVEHHHTIPSGKHYTSYSIMQCTVCNTTTLNVFIQRYHSNMPLIFLISHAQLISPRSVHITRLISNAVCSTTSLTWKRVNS